MQQLFLEHALLPDGWRNNVSVKITAEGTILSLTPDSKRKGQDSYGIALPGIVNAHSHAFQRAMAGLAEYRQSGHDSFWTWRKVMYKFLASLTPEDQRVISSQLQIELLKHGYTSLVEFHYVHKKPGGSAYADPSAMSQSVLDAAVETGIGMTLIPTLYMSADFDHPGLMPEQTRFNSDLEFIDRVLSDCAGQTEANPDLVLGIAAHSLRAVPPKSLEELLEVRKSRNLRPFHIHIAEQTKEVEACLKHTGERPVSWLLNHAPVDHNWTLVHSTHCDADEVNRLAQTKAAVALCPTTEGNLGDGIFPLTDFLSRGGRITIGSDSHVSVSPWEELRWLEYVQRLAGRKRNVITINGEANTGTSLFLHLMASAASVSGRSTGELSVGKRADLIILDDTLPQFEARTPTQILDTAIFACNSNPVRHVMVGGRWLVRDGRHVGENMIAKEYQQVLRRLGAGVYT